MTGSVDRAALAALARHLLATACPGPPGTAQPGRLNSGGAGHWAA
ncbi:MAG: hypothetical protein ACLPKI_21235 [Streptosporangiaceae bacterium]